MKGIDRRVCRRAVRMKNRCISLAGHGLTADTSNVRC